MPYQDAAFLVCSVLDVGAVLGCLGWVEAWLLAAVR
jgi:hypothetical protein